MERNSRNIKLAVGIPTYNRYDLLKPILPLYKHDFPNIPIYLVDNGKQQIEHPTVFVQDKNIGVAASWNILCETIFEEHDYAVILNDDIYLGKSHKQLIELIQKKPEKFIRATPDWCAFILPKSVYQQVGKFDECFYPAYYEDKSYEYRMKLKGLPIVKIPDLNPLKYESSKSLEKDYSILDFSKKNKKLYIEMWGGEPEREKYKKPYNA